MAYGFPWMDGSYIAGTCAGGAHVQLPTIHADGYIASINTASAALQRRPSADGMLVQSVENVCRIGAFVLFARIEHSMQWPHPDMMVQD